MVPNAGIIAILVGCDFTKPSASVHDLRIFLDFDVSGLRCNCFGALRQLCSKCGSLCKGVNCIAIVLSRVGEY